MAGFCQFTRQHHVTIEYRPCGVGNWVILVITFGQYGVERRNGPSSIAGTGAFHQLRKFGKYRWWVTLGGWRFANGERHFALRLCEARQ